MFDFFFKRARSGSATKADPATAASIKADASAVPDSSRRRQQALDQAAALGADETAALAFLLRCPVPEARLLAATQLHSRPVMEQAQKAMRETDRRVAKLMQQRLSELARQELVQQRMEASIDRAQALIAGAIVLPNQVVELDRAWADAGAGFSALESTFANYRSELGQRLQAQAALQRRAMDLVAMLRASASQSIVSTRLEQMLLHAESAMQEIEQDRSLPSLPKLLMPELRAVRAKLQDHHRALAAGEAAVAAREQALAAWQSALLDVGHGRSEQDREDCITCQTRELDTHRQVSETHDAAQVPPPPRDMPTPQALRQQWRALPAVPDLAIDTALQARFDALLAELAPALPTKRKTPAATTAARPAAGAVPEPDQNSIDTRIDDGADTAQARAIQATALDELCTALEEGALQRAVEQDRLLRASGAGMVGLSAEQQHALSAARAELTRLQGWAKWGGTVSREELVVAVEGLPQQGLGVLELGKKVGSMRERWRALDASAGPAPRPLWLRFDAACGAAYAPVAAHFAELARQREARVEKAKMILAEIAAFEAGAGVGEGSRSDAGGAPDWRAIVAFCQRMEQAWQRLGPLERKQQKQFNAAFEQALQPLRQPLQAEQEQAIALREKLIAAVAQLAPQGRDTLDQLQDLQSQWQHHAKILPLARAQEQQLWQRFRGACDAVFAQRKQAVVSADAERVANLAAKTQVCNALEQLGDDADASEVTRAALLREQRLAWNAIGPVPRVAQAVLQTRFDQALAAVQGQQDVARQRTVEMQTVVFEVALARCLACERALMSGSDQAMPALQPPWESSPGLPALLEQALYARFAAAQAALADRDLGYAQRLQENHAELHAALLRLEVRLGLESPLEVSRERLQLQVAGLQSTFKSGAADEAAATPLLQLISACALPAAIDTVAESRIRAIAKAILSNQ